MQGLQPQLHHDRIAAADPVRVQSSAALEVVGRQDQKEALMETFRYLSLVFFALALFCGGLYYLMGPRKR